MPHKVKILHISKAAKNVKRFAVEKPFADYRFIPGQATLVALDKKAWRHKQRPFTFTSLNSDKNLEFIIKIYKSDKGVTNELDKAKTGDFLLIREPFGSINYKGEGVFIAGGAGITPFIAILRQLKKGRNLDDNKLIFFNKSEEDIILKKELKEMFKNKRKNLLLALTEEEKKGYFYGRASSAFVKNSGLKPQSVLEFLNTIKNAFIFCELKRAGYIKEHFLSLKKHISDFSQKFYICGPELFVIDIIRFLKQLGVKKSNIVIERDF